MTCDKTERTRILVLRRFFARARGLIARRKLRQNVAVWIVPCRGIHTFGVRFPIDVILLDIDLTIVCLSRNIKPCSCLSRRNVHSVIEMASRNGETQTEFAARARSLVAELDQPYSPKQRRQKWRGNLSNTFTIGKREQFVGQC